jgi:hypothetical protein
VVYDDDAGESAVADTMATDDKIPAKLQERDLHTDEKEKHVLMCHRHRA